MSSQGYPTSGRTPHMLLGLWLGYHLVPGLNNTSSVQSLMGDWMTGTGNGAGFTGSLDDLLDEND